MDRVEELVESVVEQVKVFSKGACPIVVRGDMCSEHMQDGDCNICFAKQILTNPDFPLALIDTNMKVHKIWEGISLSDEVKTHLMFVIPLVEALKEVKK